MGSMRKFRTGRSPFDAIINVEEDGTEWWSAREMMPLLGYSKWENMVAVIERAKAACRNTIGDPSSIFLDVRKNSQTTGRTGLDVQMLRQGCYLVAMNGDPTKAEVASAQHYFAIATRAAELAVETVVVQAGPSISKPWSDRFRETTQAHYCYINIHHTGSFTVVSATALQILMMEDELLRHLLPTGASDLPDGSIGTHWSRYRASIGRPPSSIQAPLLMPDRKIEAWVYVYPEEELGEFQRWLTNVYMPLHMPNYYKNKPEFKPYGLPSASAADNTCRKIAGRAAVLPHATRKQLDSANGFFPVGSELPAIESGQRTMLDLFDRSQPLEPT